MRKENWTSNKVINAHQRFNETIKTEKDKQIQTRFNKAKARFNE